MLGHIAQIIGLALVGITAASLVWSGAVDWFIHRFITGPSEEES